MYGVTSLVGLALVIAPFILGYSLQPTPLWTSLILGAMITLASGYKTLTEDRANWEGWVAGIAGIVAILAPFVLGFSAVSAALWTNIILGGIVAVLAGYQVFGNPNLR